MGVVDRSRRRGSCMKFCIATTVLAKVTEDGARSFPLPRICILFETFRSINSESQTNSLGLQDTKPQMHILQQILAILETTSVDLDFAMTSTPPSLTLVHLPKHYSKSSRSPPKQSNARTPPNHTYPQHSPSSPRYPSTP